MIVLIYSLYNIQTGLLDGCSRGSADLASNFAAAVMQELPACTCMALCHAR